MEEESKAYRIFLLITLIILLGSGIFIGMNLFSDEKVPEEDEVASVASKDDVEVYVEPDGEDIIEDIEVVYVDIYKDCNHKLQKKYYIYGKTLEEVKIYEEENFDNTVNNESEYTLVKSSDGVLMYEKEYYCKCPNHYVLRMDGDKVSIYKYGENNEYVKFRETDILASTLKPEIKAQLMLGIEAETTEQLYMIIEDMES